MTDSKTEVSSVEQAGGDVEDKNASVQDVKDEGSMSAVVEDVGQDEAKRAAAETESVPSEVEQESGSELPSLRSLDILRQQRESGLSEDGAKGEDGVKQRDEDEGNREGAGAGGEEISVEVDGVEKGEGDNEHEDKGNDKEITSETGETGNSVSVSVEAEDVEGESREDGGSEMTNKTEVEVVGEAGKVDGEGKANEGQAMEVKQGEGKEEGQAPEEQEESTEAKEIEGSVDQEAREDSMTPIEEDEEVDEGPTEPADPSEPVQFVLRKAPEEDFNLEPEFDENELLFKDDDDSELSVVTPVNVAKKSAKASDGVDKGDDDDDDDNEVRVLPSVERDTYYELCRKQQSERNSLRRRNCVLQRKVLLHFKKRRANKEVFQQEIATPAQEAHYSRKLSQFGEAQDAEAEARRLAAEDVDAMEATIAQRTEELSNLLDAFIAHERDTCAMMVSQKTGKALAERLVERLLRRQLDAVDEVGAARRLHIRAMKRVSDVEDSIRGLEDLGQNLKLLDYEQLRIENQNLADKVEERDEELARFRARAVHTKAALSHFRQKFVGVHEAVLKQTEKLKAGLEELDFARNELNSLKATRDKLRADFARESAQSGLLTKPQLLRDFELTLDECQAQRANLEHLQQEIAQQQLQLEAVRALAPLPQQATSFEPRSRSSPLLDRIKKRAHPASSTRQSDPFDDIFAFV